jgi:excinuclease ABC subunit B
MMIDRLAISNRFTGKVQSEIERIVIYSTRHFVTGSDTVMVGEGTEEPGCTGGVRVSTAQVQWLNCMLYDLERAKTDTAPHRELLAGFPVKSRATPPSGFFPSDFLLIIDESHQTIPQIKGMYAGDRSRKEVLVAHGFRLPSALDNRPLVYDEFVRLIPETLYCSATPGDLELENCGGVVVEQIIRPTGLVDPTVTIRPVEGQIDDLIKEIRRCAASGKRVLVTTLTKRMAEDLADYLARLNIRVRYLHSEIDTIERTEILRDLRLAEFDVLVGINLLREGLDLPGVSLVAILDADKEGFLRSERSLMQTAGRAARNVDGQVIMYADTITNSMKKMIAETNRRRQIQVDYNREHGISPRPFTRRERDSPGNPLCRQQNRRVTGDVVAGFFRGNDGRGQNGVSDPADGSGRQRVELNAPPSCEIESRNSEKASKARKQRR